MSNITLKIDSIIEEVIKDLPSSIYKIVLSVLGGTESIINLEADSKKLLPGNFEKVVNILKEYNKTMLNNLLKKITLEIRSLMGEYSVKLNIDNFLKQIQATINLNMQGIPEQIRKDVIESVILSYDDNNIEEIAEKLRSTIGGSIKQSMNVMSEALARKVREQNFKVMKKAKDTGDMWLFSHPIDSKNDPFCRQHGNEIRSEEDWIKLKPTFFIEGGHFGCRGIPVLVKKEDIESVKKEVAPLIKKADRLDREE